MASDRFLALSNSALKVLSKNYSKVGIILDVNMRLRLKHEK